MYAVEHPAIAGGVVVDVAEQVARAAQPVVVAVAGAGYGGRIGRRSRLPPAVAQMPGGKNLAHAVAHTAPAESGRLSHATLCGSDGDWLTVVTSHRTSPPVQAMG